MITIFDNYYSEETEKAAREDIIERAEEDGRDLEEEPITEKELEDEMDFRADMDWRDLKDTLFAYMEGYACLMTGSVGRWNGTFSGGKVGEFQSLFDCLTEDCGHIKVYESRGHLFVEGSHHDGTNCMEVRFLTDKGAELYENWAGGYDSRWAGLSEREVHERLVKYYSRLPHFCKNEWGCKEIA